jgi:hypothetical protein
VYGYVGGGAKGTVGVGVGSIGVSVSDLSSSSYDDQKDTKQGEEESPSALRALS